MSGAAAAASEGTGAYYYDTDDAYNFYLELWGGENLHIGVYDDAAQKVRSEPESAPVPSRVQRENALSFRCLLVLSA